MDESLERAIKHATDLAEWRERRAGPPRILTINGVQCQEFRRSTTWRIPTPEKIRVARENKARRTQPPISLDRITRGKQYYPRINRKTIYAKCEYIPNGAASIGGGLNENLDLNNAATSSSGLNEDISVENLNPATTTDVAASSSAEVKGRSLLKCPGEDLGESGNETLIQNLKLAAADLGTKLADEVKEGESSETDTATKDSSSAAATDV